MKILINATSAKMGGAATYIKNLARELAKLTAVDEYIFYVPEEQARHMRGLSQNIKVIVPDVTDKSFLKQLYWNQIALRQILKREQVDLLFSSANLGSFPCPCRQILLVRDSTYFSELYLKTILPRKGFKFRLLFILRRLLICLSTQMADIIMTPSQSMKSDLLRFCKISESKVLVNPYGTYIDLFAGDSQEISCKSGKSETKILYVTLYGDYKNFKTLLSALLLLKKMGRHNFKLVTTANILGVNDSYSVTYDEDVLLATHPDITNHLVFVGRVPNEEIHHLYRNSTIFVFPSITESFGHPLVEAMASRLPILAADTRINREVCGDAAVYFQPFDSQDLADKLEMVLSNNEVKSRLKKESSQRIQQFRWESHVSRLLYIFRTATKAATRYTNSA